MMSAETKIVKNNTQQVEIISKIIGLKLCLDDKKSHKE